MHESVKCKYLKPGSIPLEKDIRPRQLMIEKAHLESSIPSKIEYGFYKWSKSNDQRKNV